jgi:hypothetical protein
MEVQGTVQAQRDAPQHASLSVLPIIFLLFTKLLFPPRAETVRLATARRARP